MRRFSFVLASLWLASAWALALEGPRPLDGPWIEDPGFRVEWGDGWRATSESNRKRWEKEIQAAKGADRKRLEDLFKLRLVKLHLALLEHFPDDVEGRIGSYRELAEHLGDLGCRSRSFYYYKRLIDEFPGRLDVARGALSRLLDRMGRDTDSVEEGEEWAGYAAGRLIALNEAGALTDDDPAVDAAWRSRFECGLDQGRFWEAAKALERLAGSLGRGEWWRNSEAELALRAGRRTQALKLYQDLLAQNVRGPASSRVRELSMDGDDESASFPALSTVEMIWEAVRSGRAEADEATLGPLFEKGAKVAVVVPWGRARHRSLWLAMDQHLVSQGVPPALRAAQQEAARGRVPDPARGADPQALFAAWRRYPWAGAVHAALLRYAEQALRRGQPGLALRAFQDVGTHASDPAMRARAQVGLWLALASGTEGPEALEAAFRGVAADARFPWMGESRPADFVRERLLADPGRRPAAPRPLAALQRRVLEAPAVPPWLLSRFRDVPDELMELFPWPLGQLRAADGRIFLSGPNLLAAYDGATAKLLWSRSPIRWRRWEEEPRYRPCITFPGPFLPAAADGRVYSRWGLDGSCRALTGLAAFDAASGEMLWSTERDPAWERLSPVGDPAAAEGRLYVLATREEALGMRPAYLVCLDAASGATLWQRFLGSQSVAVLRADGAPSLPRSEVDLATYGSALTVDRGAVYCLTNMGFVARCDARDGLVEWARTYPRVRLGYNTRNTLRRQGGPPAVAGDLVVFVPRDGDGALAVDRETGALAWDVPFVPSDGALGLAGGRVLLWDSEHLVALGRDGGVAWERRFPEGLRGRPAIVGSSIVVAAGDGLLRLAADTGLAIETSDWDRREPIRDFAVEGGSLVALTDGGMRPEAGGTRPEERGPVRLPLERAWLLPGAGPRVGEPPPEAKVADRLYALADGLLTCLATEAQGRIEWQRVLPGDYRQLVWGERTMAFVYPRHVLALDALSGALRWERDLPFEARDWAACGPYLFVGNLKQGLHAALLSLSDGRMLWYRRFVGLMGHGYRCTIEHVAWDGERVHLIASDLRQGRQVSGADFLVRPTDGQLVGFREFPEGEQSQPAKLVLGDGFAFGVTKDKASFTYSIRDGAVVAHRADLGSANLQKIEKLETAGPWILVRWRQQEPNRTWVLRRGDPAWLLQRKALGRVIGDRLYEAGEGTLTVVDLSTGKEVACAVSSAPGAGDVRGFLDYGEAGGRIWVLSDVGPSPRREDRRVRVDMFDRSSGACVGSQVLDEVPAEGARAFWAKGAVLIASAHGLQGFAAAPRERPAPPGDLLAYRMERPMRLDGSLADWPQEAAVPLEGAPGRQGTLRVAHDRDRLYLAIQYRDPRPRPRVGRGEAGAGDWVEVALTAGPAAWHLGVGVDPRGQVAWEAPGGEDIPQGVEGGARFDPAAQEVTCELGVPIEALFRRSGDRQRIGLSVAVWDEGPGGGTRGRDAPPTGQVLHWGGALAGPEVCPASHRTVVLYPRTREEEAALAAIVNELPDLPEAMELFRRSCEAHAAAADQQVELFWAFIRQHPRSAAAEELLSLIERKLREKPAADPTADILRRAAEAGVPEAVRRRFEAQSRTYLSQWVHVPSGGNLRSLMIEVSDGLGANTRDEWGHRAYWGKPAMAWTIPPTGMGELADVPRDKWHELRVPLRFIDMHDKPICGINFCQQGTPRIVWDRSAIVAGGKERVFLDDEMPPGVAIRDWQWVDSPVHSGKRAHTQEPPPGHYDVRSHTLLELDEPIADHLVPPLDRPCLSQWVWLDPASPPSMLSLDLHDGRRWRFAAVWGERKRKGLYLGPLPRPGEWHELRVPLAWTPFVARPIVGIAFGHYGGRAVWDRTAVVADGKDHVILDDEPPATRPGPETREWLGWLQVPGLRHVGRTTAFSGKRGVGVHFDGWSGFVDVPHSPELDPPQLTVEAWIYMTRFPGGSDTRRWIINKNRHESTEGHYALVVNSDAAGAYLNIGDGEKGRYSAWSEPGTLALGRWQHLAMTYDGATLRFYLGGEEAASAPVNKPRVPGATSLQIGRRVVVM